MDRRLLLALALIAPAFAGCLGDDAGTPASAGAPTKTAAEAGGASGDAPKAPTEAYAVAASTAYPLPLASNAARAPVTLDLSGEFKPGDCRPFQFGGIEDVLKTASWHRRPFELHEHLKVGDVFEYNITLTYTNAPDNWGEIYAAYGLGSTVREYAESTREHADVVVSWAGQGFRASEDDMAWVVVGCWLGAMTRPIHYTFTVTISYAEGAIPSEAPVLVSVPEGATKLFVGAVPRDPAKGVLSHFRVFDTSDQLLCECALSSQDEVAEVALPGPGDYVLLVDHTDNGFVSVALDAPGGAPVRALTAEWVETELLTSPAGAVDETIAFDLPRVPLLMWAHVRARDDAGAGKHTQLTITNGRGEPLHASWGGHIAAKWPTGGNMWTGIWPADWEFTVDHHAFAPGAHTATIQAEELRGTVYLFTRQYVR